MPLSRPLLRLPVKTKQNDLDMIHRKSLTVSVIQTPINAVENKHNCFTTEPPFKYQIDDLSHQGHVIFLEPVQKGIKGNIDLLKIQEKSRWPWLRLTNWMVTTGLTLEMDFPFSSLTFLNWKFKFAQFRAWYLFTLKTYCTILFSDQQLTIFKYFPIIWLKSKHWLKVEKLSGIPTCNY